MVFSSLLFLFRFLPVVLILYFLAPGKLKNLVLFLMSLIFYAWGEPVYVVLMLFSTVVDYVHGRLVEHFKTEGKIRWAKCTVASSVIINLGLLCFFKYSDFLITNINLILNTSIPLLELSLPIGISFYTFQTMSYTIDVYRGDARMQKNIISFGTYVALFPQLIAGPIVQYKTVDSQLNHRKHTVEGFAWGVRRFVVGLGKKVLLANNIGILWDQIQTMSVSSTSSFSVLTAWIGAIAFAFQIYFDFSGYSDMAIGLGGMFGFRFLENFNHPYESRSITEFWRRWHISLGTWFREYVYIPLGGNRKGARKQVRNILIVWALTGIWHGASWNFMAWGLYFGVLLVVEKFWLGKYIQKLPDVVQRIYALGLVLISWMLFAFDSLVQGCAYIGKMFGVGVQALLDGQALYYLNSYGILLLILSVGSTCLPKLVTQRISNRLGEESWGFALVSNIVLVGIFILSVAFIVDASYNPFLYFRF
ncbi:MAG: MBOAT family O-acyltransferase [Lachnospiraceae bacterium]